MNNSRGNKYSKLHSTLDSVVSKCSTTQNRAYWEFSFQEMSEFDLPAIFEFVLAKTGVQSLSYVGHSQGTTQLLAALCENPEFYRDKLNVAILLAPVVTTHRCLAKLPHDIAESAFVFDQLTKLGPELFTEPQGDTKVKQGALFNLGVGSLGIV
jgi:pimeloyl-ACP methyl ester carboxylesterase